MTAVQGVVKRARRQWQERDVGRNPELLGTVPAGLIEDENGVRAGGDLGGDLVEMKLHGFTVAHRQHEGGASAAIRADRIEQVGRRGALIMGGAGARALAGPAQINRTFTKLVHAFHMKSGGSYNLGN
jgi:hypothetical protein